MSKQITTGRNKAKGQRRVRQSKSFKAELAVTKTSKCSNQAAVTIVSNLLPINPKGEFLTAEKLRAFEGCNHYNDQEALAVIESLSTLARIVLATSPKRGTPIDNQRVLHLDTNIQPINQAA